MGSAAGRMFVAAAITACLMPRPSFAVEVGEVFQNWTVRCEQDAATDTEQCFISQSIALREGRQRVLNVDIGYAPQRSEPVALITLPLGISLPPGASIRVDDKPAHNFAIERCEPSGCRGGIIIEEPLITWLKQGRQATVAFYDAGRSRLEVPLRLAGLSEGLQALRGD
jgi:invasion protein IalB